MICSTRFSAVLHREIKSVHGMWQLVGDDQRALIEWLLQKFKLDASPLTSP
jgi:hypothetical protein